MISRRLISTFRTMMNSFFEFFLSSMGIALGTDLTSVFMVNSIKVLAPLPTYPRQQISKLTEATVEHLFAQKASSSHFQVDIFNKNHVCLVAQEMACDKVKVFSSITYLMVKSSNFNLCFFPVFRLLFLSTGVETPISSFAESLILS